MQFLTALPGLPMLTALGMLYLMLGLASLGVGWSVRQRPRSQLRDQVFAWWWIFPVVTVSLLLHPAGAALLALLIGVLALRELAPFAGPRFVSPAAAILGAALVMGYVSPPLSGLLLGLAGVMQAARFLFSRTTGNMLWLLWLLLCFSLSFLPAYEQLALAPSQRLGWLFYLYVLTALNDVAQFITGTLFGRHRVAPGISPNKTWQGLAGGVLVSLLLSQALGGYLQLAAPLALAAYAVLLSVGGFCGDLMFSAAKRALGIKDFSTLIPGHGGILDRVDSLVVTAPLLYLIVRTLHES